MRLAQELEALGYHRFWVSEHHSVPGVAGSAPTVLAAAVAAATSTIRVGTGGVMLPNHQPLVVAEQFGVLESLFPGRIDMGLGRSVGFTDGIRTALGRDKKDAEDFAGQLTELLGWFDGEQSAHPQVHARPAEGLRVPPYVLADRRGCGHRRRGRSAAGDRRHPGPRPDAAAIDRYRAGFRPSAWSEVPYVVVSGTVAVAGTQEEARRLLMSEAWAMAYSRTHGMFPPLAPPERIEALSMTAKERGFYESGLRGPYRGHRGAGHRRAGGGRQGQRGRRGAGHDQYLRPWRAAGLLPPAGGDRRRGEPGGGGAGGRQPHRALSLAVLDPRDLSLRQAAVSKV